MKGVMIGALALGALVAAAAANGWTRANVWSSPTRNIVCAYRPAGGTVECETINNKSGAFVPPYSGAAVPLSYQGRPGIANPWAVPVLGYGWSWTVPGIRCTMSMSGVRCA